MLLHLSLYNKIKMIMKVKIVVNGFGYSIEPEKDITLNDVQYKNLDESIKILRVKDILVHGVGYKFSCDENGFILFDETMVRLFNGINYHITQQEKKITALTNKINKFKEAFNIVKQI